MLSACLLPVKRPFVGHSRLIAYVSCPQLTKYPVLVNLEEKTQVPKTYIVLGGGALAIFLHLFNSLASPVSNLLGWALPAYLSFKAIESPSPQDDIQWLTYWVVFGFFNFLESFALRAVLYYFPWYFAFKTVFVLWLQLPAFRVSTSSFDFCFWSYVFLPWMFLASSPLSGCEVEGVTRVMMALRAVTPS